MRIRTRIGVTAGITALFAAMSATAAFAADSGWRAKPRGPRATGRVHDERRGAHANSQTVSSAWCRTFDGDGGGMHRRS